MLFIFSYFGPFILQKLIKNLILILSAIKLCFQKYIIVLCLLQIDVTCFEN